MIFNRLNEIATSRDLIENFGGYNHNDKISDNEFYDMKNMCSDSYPIAATRRMRSAFNEEYKCRGMLVKEGVFAIYYNGKSSNPFCHAYYNGRMINDLFLENSDKQLIPIGAYIIILPDRVWFNTLDESYGNIEVDSSINPNITYSLCREDGSLYSSYVAQEDAPENPADRALWVDKSSTPHVLKQYSATSSTWVQIATTYIRISATNIADRLEKYDAVKISGIDTTSFPQLADLEGQISPLWDVHHGEGAESAGDYIVVVGILDETVTQTTGTLRIERKMPDMDFVIESNNRLWGCKYGMNASGEVLNEIYASKLGDFKNWNCYMGLSTDSYTASCGTDGAFTGAITHMGYPLFFKETVMHKVFGNFPSNFQIQTTECRGVQKGAGRSLAIVGDTLFYKSLNGVCAYNGSLPTEISSAFGGIKYSAVDEGMSDKLRNGAVAGSCGNKYYISMRSEKDLEWNQFVFDAEKGLWHREDDFRSDGYAEYKGKMLAITHGDPLNREDPPRILDFSGEGNEDALVQWYVVTGLLTRPYTQYGSQMTADNKYISRINVRMWLDVTATVSFYAEYDSSGSWEAVTPLIRGNGLRSFTIPIRPKRCDHMRLKIEGAGNAKIFSIAKTYEGGSDV